MDVEIHSGEGLQHVDNQRSFDGRFPVGDYENPYEESQTGQRGWLDQLSWNRRRRTLNLSAAADSAEYVA